MPHNPAYTEKVIYFFPQDLNLLGEEKKRAAKLDAGSFMVFLSTVSYNQTNKQSSRSSSVGICGSAFIMFARR